MVTTGTEHVDTVLPTCSEVWGEVGMGPAGQLRLGDTFQTDEGPLGSTLVPMLPGDVPGLAGPHSD